MKKIAVLYSSGVESASLTVNYLDEGFLVYPVYVRCGLPWEKAEVKWASRLWSYLRGRYKRVMPFRTVFLRGLGVSRGIEIPLRNLVLTTHAAIEAIKRDVKGVAVGSLGIYPFPDNNREYFDALQNLIRKGSKEEFRIETPFMGMEKWEVIRKFYGRLRYELTFSCVRPVKGMHCGRCLKCLERKEGFKLAGVKDPTFYLS